jgi:hypothetical protein
MLETLFLRVQNIGKCTKSEERGLKFDKCFKLPYERE